MWAYFLGKVGLTVLELGVWKTWHTDLARLFNNHPHWQPFWGKISVYRSPPDDSKLPGKVCTSLNKM